MRGAAQIDRQRLGGGQGGGRVARTMRLPAPVRGLNTSAPIQVLDPREAVVLTNMICRPQGAETREGYIGHVTGLGARVDALMEYAPAGAGGKLFAAAGSSIFDVTAEGAVGAAVQTGLTSAYWRHTMMATPAGQFLFAVNGADAPRHFNGSAWAAPTITGVTPAELTNVVAHKNRLWLVQKDTLTAWYLPTAAIAGAASSFPMGGFCRRGGRLVALGTWSRDGGAGADDLLVAVTSEGEVLIFSGTDPSVSTAWALVGVFQIPPPVGPRCFVKAGADLGVITARGLISLDSVLPMSASEQSQSALTNKIEDAFARAWRDVGASDAWQVIEAPAERIVLINVPSDPPEQFCLGLEVGGWSQFADVPATAWGARDDVLYFGTADGQIMRYGGSYDDGGEPIAQRVLPAFALMKSNANKLATLMRPIIQAADGVTPRFEMRFDYDVRPVTLTPSSSIASARWDEAVWDEAWWEPPISPQLRWQVATGHGVAVSVAMAVATDTKLVVQGFDLVFQDGGLL
jgi:hypothetical protein